MIEAWELVGEHPGGAGYLPLVTRSYALPDGSPADWDIFGWDQVAAVLAITPDSQVVLARQFRPGPGVVLDELPGGLVESGEEVVPAATRELLEETGYAGEAELAGRCWMAAACRTVRHVVVVRNARRIADPTPDQGEFVGVVLKSLAAFRQQLRKGALTDVDLGYLALDHLGLLG